MLLLGASLILIAMRTRPKLKKAELYHKRMVGILMTPGTLHSDNRRIVSGFLTIASFRFSRRADTGTQSGRHDCELRAPNAKLRRCVG
jgi:hypothetical protein